MCDLQQQLYSPNSKKQFEHDQKTDFKKFDCELAKSILKEMSVYESKYGLLMNPYQSKNTKVTKDQRNRILELLLEVQHSSVISDFAFLVAVYMFDKIAEQAIFAMYPKDYQLLDKQPFKVAAMCLYLAAKFEDQKYPYFESYVNLLDKRTQDTPENKQTTFKNEQEILDIELFIWKHVNFNMNIPISYKYYERFARIAFIQTKQGETKELSFEIEFNLGIYLLFIAAFYPSILFDYSQAQIAASVIYLVLKIRGYENSWSTYLQEITGFPFDEIIECSKRIVHKYVGVSTQKQPYYERIGLVHLKFKLNKYLKVASIIPDRHSSAQGILAMLQDKERDVQIYALRKLDQIVHYNWHEISDYVSKIEALVDDPTFPQKDLAASIASKVFYYLEEYEESLRLALEAGDRFDLNERSQYVETLIHKCIDKYIEKRVQLIDQKDESVVIDDKMEGVINKMFDRCFQDNQYNQAIGVALESRRLDKVREAIERSTDVEEKLGYTITIAQNLIKSKSFRTEILKLLLLIYENKQGGKFDYYKIVKCQFFLNMPDACAILLNKLIQTDDYLVAYQIAFDILDNENQSFTKKVLEHLNTQQSSDKLSKLKAILTGEIRDRLYLQFLKKNNHTDMMILSKIKEKIGQRNSILHGATIWTNGIMNAYTTNDVFLRDNLSWAAQATNWNRFNATATLGMIHMGNKKEAMAILNPYFTGAAGPEQQSSPYSTAGAYYAYGLINANQYNQDAVNYFLEGFRNSGQNESIQHGICLGLGLTAMATNNDQIYEELKNVLFNNADSAIIGEAAGYGLGLVMLGSANENAIEEMITHANDSKHEKIIRALSISLALIMYGKEDNADGLIEQMVRSKDSIMRYGAMFAIGCAYAGTNNNTAVQKLLHYAVSDVSDDVKRAALMNLGFLLFKKPEKIPELVKQLAESYNPHLRYGAAFAVGIGCAGTGLIDALKLLAPLTNDQVDFVRQGALLALSMVFVQITEAQEPKVVTIKKLYTKMIEDKHEEILSRMGAILAQGIINAAGRNATITLTTKDGNLRQNAVVGLVLFLQYWYWYPLLNFLSLAMSPTALIGVNEDLKVPKSFTVVSNAKPSLYKYPEFLKKEEGKEKGKVETAVLSTTAKVKARVGRKHKADGDEKMQDATGTAANEETKDKEMTDEEKKKQEEEKKAKEPEPDFQDLRNPSRVLKAQEKKIQYKEDGRWYPVLENRFSGYVVLRDQRPDSQEPEQYYDDEERDPNAPNPDRQSDLDIPEEFEFDPAIQNAQ